MVQQEKTIAEQLAEANKNVEFVADKDNKDKVKGLVTQKQIDAWKAANPVGVFAVKSEGHIGYFGYPSRSEMNDAILNPEEGNPFGAYELMMQMSFLGGSVELLTNPRLFATVIHKYKAKIDGNAEVLDF